VIGMLYAAVLALVQTDIKRLVIRGISHMISWHSASSLQQHRHRRHGSSMINLA
jgi:NADH:ubiquinone oxidoreductase subunit 4 (subunit M)